MPVRVAVVDDDAGFRRVAVLLLTMRGYDVVGEASDADTGFRLIAATSPDAALIDYHLSDGDGAELCRRLAALPAAPRVLLTSSDAGLADVPGLGAPFLPKERLATADLAAYL